MSISKLRRERAVQMFEKYVQPVIEKAVPKSEDEWQLFTASATTAEQKQRNRLAARKMSKIMDSRLRKIAMEFCLMQEEMTQEMSGYADTGAADTEPRSMFGHGVDVVMDYLKEMY